MFVRRFLLILVLAQIAAWPVSSLSTLGAEATAGPPDAIAVLNDRTLWRWHVSWRMPAMGTARKAEEPAVELFESRPSVGRWIRVEFSCPTPLPAADWMAADFDDWTWMRRRGPFFAETPYSGDVYAGLICLRGRFGVTDPSKAKGLRLTLEYRGGVVVYLNGAEIARGHLPSGKITPLTLAEDYPKEAFLSPDGKTPLPTLGRRAKPAPELLARYGARIRRTIAHIPSKGLRRGVNVLAVEVHRAAIPPGIYGERRGGQWGTAGLIKARLTAAPGSAVEPNVAPPKGVQIWTADALLQTGEEVSCGDPFEGLRPLRLMAPRNGRASGQVVVSAPEAFSGLSAAVIDLKSADGTTVPAGAVRIRYGKFGPGFTPLTDRPAEGERVQTVWLTVKVPPDAKPAIYKGTVTIRGVGEDRSVPVELTVYGWKVGDPKEWATSVGVLQSPESVAGYYKVPMWSSRHWTLIEKSIRLMAETGNEVLGVSAVARTVFGDDPMVLFRKQGQTWVPDFAILDRYLATYAKYAQPPRFLSLQVWHYGMYYSGRTRDGTKRDHSGPYPLRAETIPVGETRGDAIVTSEMPIFGKPGTEAIWTPVIEHLREKMKDLGWTDTRLVLGTSGDNWPSPETVAFFKKIAPGAGWRVCTHGGGVRKWGMTPQERTQPNGMVVVYPNMVRRGVWKRDLPPDCRVGIFERDGIGDSVFDHLGLAALSTAASNHNGFCWHGIDYWGFPGPDGKVRRVLAAYVPWGNLVPHRPMAMAAPGPNGALGTPQLDLLREGVQMSEAMLYMKRAIEDPARRARLGEDLAKRCETVTQGLCDLLESGRRLRPKGSSEVRRQMGILYTLASEVAEALDEK